MAWIQFWEWFSDEDKEGVGEALAGCGSQKRSITGNQLLWELKPSGLCLSPELFSGLFLSGTIIRTIPTLDHFVVYIVGDIFNVQSLDCVYDVGW